ncbi:T9SS type A sorting domain-containing protein [Olleya aquimaris]|uniref:Putative secreted protein (Por secretion system target) n=1 Tax=Olleya aquimaris TaxID=639310 RepID=A0A327RNW8_9FLAO|nr:T9SS type A sorting domain-containing protein [Olleya aquimaris]RAJ18191.1 putative secreted protein (Por secretion system target) [Olleya aquimaris]
MKQLYLVSLLLLTLSFGFAQPANDDCSNAQIITVSTTNLNVPFDINTATLNNQEGCSGTTADYADVWFEFTMPTNGNLYIDGSLSWNQFAIYDSCGGTELNCFSSNGLLDNLASGTTYKLRVFRGSGTASNTSYQNFNIIAFDSVTNDDCASSENITVSATPTTVNFEIGGAQINNEEGCTGTTNNYLDVWYDFTMPFDGNLYIGGDISWNNFALYDACSGTEIQCGNTNEFIEGLSSGTTYKLRVFRTIANADNSSYKSFSIVAYQSVANDTCATSENITVSTTASTVNFEIGGAEINNEEGCTSTTADYLDIWYDFTMPVSGNLYIDGSLSWNNFALYDACGGTLIQCGSSNEFIEGLTATTNYKLRVFRTVANADNTSYKSFSIIAYETVTNDDCASAENITLTTDQQTINFEIGGASINNEEGCTSTMNDYADIWYEFTMPVNGNVYVNGAINWNNFALYDACNGNLIQCGSSSEQFDGLTATTNYKLRVFRTLANTDNNGYRSFTIQAFEIINNDDCATAETINVLSGTPTTINFGIAGASINNEEGCSGGTVADYADIWYQFTMPEDGYIIIDGTINWNNFALYDACSGTELGCFSASGNIGGLTNGNTYLLRVFRGASTATNTSYKSFTIESSATLSTTNFNLEQSITVYPNPTSSVITISGSVAIQYLEVYSLLGQPVLKVNTQNQIDLTSLEAGMYVLNIHTKQGILTKKIIKN